MLEVVVPQLGEPVQPQPVAPSPATLPAETIRSTESLGTRPMRTVEAGDRYEPNDPARSTCWTSVWASPSSSSRRVQPGHGGHFLGSMHTMERFCTCFYRPFLSSSDNHERWMRGGALGTSARAANVWRKKLEEYEQPPLDDAIRAELEDFVGRRRTELGD